MEQVQGNDKLQTKLARALSKIGLSWATYSSIVDIRSKIEGIEVLTALWYYNPKTKKEHIAIDPKIIQEYNAEEIGLVIKHELLHKAMYRNLDVKDQMLANFALDCCINKILTLSNPRTMYEFCKSFYNIDITNVSAICNCSITENERDALQKNIREIWNDIYTSNGHLHLDEFRNNRCYNLEVPDPLTIYNKILLSFNKKQKEDIEKTYNYAKGDNKDEQEQDQDEQESDAGPDNNEEENDKNDNEENKNDIKKENKESEPEEKPEETLTGDTEDSNERTKTNNATETDERNVLNDEENLNDNKNKMQIRGGPDNKRANDKQSVKDEIGSIKKIFEGTFCPRGVNEILEKMIFEPQEANTKDLKAFIGTWQTMRQVEGIEATIYAEIASHVKFDPFPDSLSRTGFEYIALGVSGPDAIPLYLNQNDKRDARKKVCCYFDTSPSMNEALPYMVHIAKFFDALEETQLAGGESAGKYVFAGNVEGLTHDQWIGMCNGEIKTGWTTDFNRVIEHANKIINEEEVDIIVILTDGESSLSNENIEAFNSTTKRCYRIYFDFGRSVYGIKKTEKGVESSLDRLNGESFTVRVGRAVQS